MMEQMRVLIGTMYAGENEFHKCVESIRAQSYSNWEHQVYSHLPNKAAHDTLYGDFMSRSADFDVFLKLDADMVFVDSESLGKIVALFRADPALDVVTSAVYDWYSDSLLIGMHAYSRRVTWESGEEDLFVDYHASFPGKKVVLRRDPAPLAIHSPDPSPIQAFRFGIHRALKAFQPGRDSFDAWQSLFQWVVLNRVWSHFTRTWDRRLGLAILGADQVMDGTAGRSHYDAGSDAVWSIYGPYAECISEEVYVDLARRWANPVSRHRAYMRLAGGRVLAGLGRVVGGRA
jgi:hypothetical protein